LHRPYIDEITFTCPACQEGKMYRVPELIDVWFDSGSMPVAQWHYPFENAAEFRAQFPADFICEAVDQTRGWFYSLHAISTMLFDSAAYKNVLCLGLILDGEGRKMSKSLGNIIDPWEVLNTHGADALRWYLYTATPPGQERRFSVDLVGQVVRTFMLTLWNTYAFFVTYANLDGWGPKSQEPNPESQAESVLDRWILSELHTLTRDVTAAYEGYDVTGATRPLEKFVDDLSNWYLRRSRRRFWKSGVSADKQAAYATLYECLTTLARLLAPAMPFLADVLYRNLALSVDPAQPESVHLADWPKSDSARIDEKLNAEMRLVMKLASLGHGARNKASRKVRQPLAEAAFAVGSAEELHVVSAYADLIADELNVKAVRALGAAGEAVAYALNPLPKQLGQKHGGRFPKIRAALLKLDPEPAAKSLLAGRPVAIEVDGQTVEVLPEDVEVRMNAREGLAVLGEGSYLAALKTTLTPELVREGLAREFVRRVQDLRKKAGFDIADRIITYYTATPQLVKAIVALADYIKGETLSVELVAGPAPQGAAPEGAATVEDTFGGEKVKVEVVKK
jgi:isoleucyl-tRNA synthetase